MSLWSRWHRQAQGSMLPGTVPMWGRIPPGLLVKAVLAFTMVGVLAAALLI